MAFPWGPRVQAVPSNRRWRHGGAVNMFSALFFGRNQHLDRTVISALFSSTSMGQRSTLFSEISPAFASFLFLLLFPLHVDKSTRIPLRTTPLPRHGGRPRAATTRAGFRTCAASFATRRACHLLRSLSPTGLDQNHRGSMVAASAASTRCRGSAEVRTHVGGGQHESVEHFPATRASARAHFSHSPSLCIGRWPPCSA